MIPNWGMGPPCEALKNDTVNKWALSLVTNVARVEQLRRFAGSWFQAEGAATQTDGGDWNVE